MLGLKDGNGLLSIMKGVSEKDSDGAPLGVLERPVVFCILLPIRGDAVGDASSRVVGATVSTMGVGVKSKDGAAVGMLVFVLFCAKSTLRLSLLSFRTTRRTIKIKSTASSVAKRQYDRTALTKVPFLRRPDLPKILSVLRTSSGPNNC